MNNLDAGFTILLLSLIAVPVALWFFMSAVDLLTIDLPIAIGSLIDDHKAAKTARLIQLAEFTTWHYRRNASNQNDYLQARLDKALNV